MRVKTLKVGIAGLTLGLLAAMAMLTGCAPERSPARVETPPAGATATAASNTTLPGAAEAWHETGMPTGVSEDQAMRNANLETATFAAGCFWGVEDTFRQVKGVTKTVVGYTGGRTSKPTYGDVCSDKSGHAEAVQVTFDPGVATYEQLLDVFWANHNPTTMNRQGPDYGSQYRSAVFYHSPAQKAGAEASKARLGASGKWRSPIVTEIVPASEFWPAEEYHQQYLAKHGMSSCHIPGGN